MCCKNKHKVIFLIYQAYFYSYLVWHFNHNQNQGQISSFRHTVYFYIPQKISLFRFTEITDTNMRKHFFLQNLLCILDPLLFCDTWFGTSWANEVQCYILFLDNKGFIQRGFNLCHTPKRKSAKVVEKTKLWISTSLAHTFPLPQSHPVALGRSISLASGSPLPILQYGDNYTDLSRGYHKLICVKSFEYQRHKIAIINP